MPCCVLLHDLCRSLANLESGFDFGVLLGISEVECDLQIQMRFVDEILEAGL